MRTVFFAGLIVVASFAGGAVINNPSIDWSKAKAILRSYLSDSADGPEVVDVDLEGSAHDRVRGKSSKDDGGEEGGSGVSDRRDGRGKTDLAADSEQKRDRARVGSDSAKRKPLDLPVTDSERPAKVPPARPFPGSGSAANALAATLTPPASKGQGESSAAAKSLESPPPLDPSMFAPLASSEATSSIPGAGPAPLSVPGASSANAKAKVADTKEVPPAPPSNASSDSRPKKDSAVTTAVLDAFSALANPVVKASTQGAVPPATDQPESLAAGASANDWNALRARMKTLGVRRYTIEGDPQGKVRFVCSIPVAGERAVSQQFEAEANSELEAARAALKRVELWKSLEQDDEVDEPANDQRQGGAS